MITAASRMKKQVEEFCAQIGADPLLVQGAGGNVSWKDGDALWVKASGMWLAEAESKEIFVPVNLKHLKDSLAKQDFSVKPEIASSSGLRPSIETLLHALMPHRVVVHLHAVEILTHLVRVNARQKIENLVGDAVQWIFVDYFKPGADLARAISDELKTTPDADVIFMANHGVVIASGNVENVSKTLQLLIRKMQIKKPQLPIEDIPSARQKDFYSNGYTPCIDKEVSRLSINDNFISKLRNGWALYPDHVVFLGAEAHILEKDFTMLDLKEVAQRKPPVIFAIHDGVYESTTLTPSQKSQLRCFYDVISRLDSEEILSVLSAPQVAELLNWEAEKYRQD